MVCGMATRLFHAEQVASMICSILSKTVLGSQLSRRNCWIFSTGFSLGARDGRKIRLMLRGILQVVCASCAIEETRSRGLLVPRTARFPRRAVAMRPCREGEAPSQRLCRVRGRSPRTARYFQSAGQRADVAACLIVGRCRSSGRSRLRPDTRFRQALPLADGRYVRSGYKGGFLNVSMTARAWPGCRGLAVI